MIVHDSITAADIPADAGAVAGYIDGFFAWSEADWDRFATLYKIRIAVRPSTNDGDMGDVENGDMLPADTPGWVTMRRKNGAAPLWWPPGIAWPLLYCSQSTWGDVQLAMAGAGVATDYCIADPEPPGMPAGTPHMVPGAVATQFAWEPVSGGHFDLSLFFAPMTLVIETIRYQEDNLKKLSMTVPPLDDQGNGSILVPLAADKVVSVIVNGNDPNHQGYDGITPTIETSARGPDELIVFQKSKPHVGFGIKVWVTS